MPSQNKGEWSELYAFARLLRDGRIYAADKDVNKIEDVFFPILKIIRSNEHNQDIDYMTGNPIRIYHNGKCLGEMSQAELTKNVKTLFEKIFRGGPSAAFEIPEIDDFIDNMKITQIKASSNDKVDIRMQLHDIHTGFEREAGFSIKSDIGSAPTLLNPDKGTRIVYEINGIDDDVMNRFNAITKEVDRNYMIARMKYLFESNMTIKFREIRSDVYTDNLMLIDTMMPEIYGNFILLHYATIPYGKLDCDGLCNLLQHRNPLNYAKQGFYKYKIKKLLCSSALGMTPNTPWDGYDAATGGYIIVKKNGDVLCYHIYNRDHFEEYLLENTKIDRPSASRYDYGYIYKKHGRYLIDLNSQIRFKQISGQKRNSNCDLRNLDVLDKLR